MNYPGKGLHGHAVEVLGGRIVGGHYPPGSLLHPDLLEHELGVSTTVVRETLQVLAAKGLIDSRQKRGTRVRSRADWNLLDGDLLRWQGQGTPDVAFLDNLAEVRAIVEPAGGRLAASRRDETDLAALPTPSAGWPPPAPPPAPWWKPTWPFTGHCWRPPTTSCSPAWRW